MPDSNLTPQNEAVIQCLAALIEQESRGETEPALITIHPYSAYVLISLLQLAWRHPHLTEHHRTIAVNIARDLQAMFGPPLAEALESGWDVSQDVIRGQIHDGN